MRYWKTFMSRLVLAVSLIFLLGGTANAAPTLLTIDGQFTIVPAGLAGVIPVGSPFSMDLSIDDAEPNIGTAPDYHAVNAGTLSSFLLIPVPGSVDDISLDALSDTWTGLLSLDLGAALPGTVLATTVTLTGTGYTPGQILPDFSAITFGQILIDTVALAGSGIEADVTGVSFGPAPVPEPGTALLVGVGLAMMARHRRRLA